MLATELELGLGIHKSVIVLEELTVEMEKLMYYEQTITIIVR